MPTARRSSTPRIPALLVALAVLAGCSPASGPLGTPSSPAPTGNSSVVPPSGDATPGPSTTATASPCCSGAAVPSPTSAPTTLPSTGPSGTTIVRVYFILGSSAGTGGLVPVLREIPATVGVAGAAVRQLIAGPDAAESGAQPELGTAVPAATRLLGLTIKGGVAAVDLSSEFLGGYNGSQPDERFAQVVYTLTQFSTVTSVSFTFDGAPFAGPLPATRDASAIRSFLPAIFVDHPAWGAAAGNPATVSGVANVFEATFRVRVEDASGTVLADQQVMATCGTGCWGDFSVTLAYTLGKAQWGTLHVFDLSAKDGTPENVTEYPVWLTPGV